MHISDGVLSTQVIAAGWILTGAGAAIGLRKMNLDKIVHVAFASSVFFLASLINVRIPPSSVHLSLLGPMGLLLGWSSFPGLFVALLLQALLFQFGGLLSLGVNTFNHAAAAMISWFIFSGLIRRSTPLLSAVFSFSAGAFAVLLSSALVALSLYLSNKGMANAAYFILYAHLPLAVIEGIVTLFIASFYNTESGFSRLSMPEHKIEM